MTTTPEHSIARPQASNGTGPLPFDCPSCGTAFGLGPDAALLSVFNSVHINGEATPCCGALIWGRIETLPELTLIVERFTA